MTDPSRRALLHLNRAASPSDPARTVTRWKCKPCGEPFDVGVGPVDAAVVRCPACGARLGLADHFRSDPPRLDRIRARRIAADTQHPAVSPTAARQGYARHLRVVVTTPRSRTERR